MTHTTLPRRRGLTLVEVLVVIAVIGILVGLLLPAIQSARSSGRRSQCANNLKQLGAAVQQFHQRHGTLPTYWGPMKNAGGELFGPWLMHLLPDLGQQNLYDQFIPSAAEQFQVERGTWTTGTTIIRDAIQATPGYDPGRWEVTSYVNLVGQSIPIYTLVGQVGEPAQGPWFDQTYTVTGTDTIVNNAGLHPKFDDVASVPISGVGSDTTISIPVLGCSDDISGVPPNWMQRGRNNRRWGLTNYMANAHVFMKFGNQQRLFSGTGAVATSGTMGGRFPRATASRIGGGGPGEFTHAVSGSAGLNPRQFAHIVDGLSNTIMFGEGMRQCDNGASFRYAFLPTAERGDEHAFGIDVAITEVPALSGLTQDFTMGYGNTLMFQLRPPMSGCNKFRLQANHDVLNVAMCDGSVRGISSRVTRREQCDPDVAGREYGRNTYNPEGLGGVGIGPSFNQRNLIPDGIWDMLMVPNDPPNNVLANTGEVGKEK